MKLRTNLTLNLADTVVLWSLAVAQPLYDLLSRNAEYLVAHRASAGDILWLTIILSLAAPGLLFAVEVLVDALGSVAGRIAHVLVVAMLLCLTLFPPLKRAFQLRGWFGLVFLLIVCLILSGLYSRYRTKALTLATVSPVVLLLAAIFVFRTPVRGLVFGGGEAGVEYPRVRATAPIVMVVFDELPVVSLMDERREIDPQRYPNFAALCRNATWYRNASTVGESTAQALPAILDGLYPRPDQQRLPTAKDHPRSLFALFGRSHRFDVVENTTQVCPPNLRAQTHSARSLRTWFRSWLGDAGVVYLHFALPASWTSGLPSISQSWKDFTKAGSTPAGSAPQFAPLSDSDDPKYVFEEFIKRIPSGQSTFSFLHVRLPHVPWLYLPSGRRYSLQEETIRGVVGTNDVGEDPSRWTADQSAVMQGYQRHLLQVGMADTMLGRLISHLKAVGVYESSLIIVTADHGASFRSGDSRRIVTPSNYADIIAVPLIIKAPGQTQGAIDDLNVETIDILPTVAGILGIELPWKVDGQSALERPSTDRKSKTVIADRGVTLRFSPGMEARYDTLARQLEWFGSGRWDSVYRIGVWRELVGRTVAEVGVQGGVPGSFSLDGESFFNHVDFNAPVLLTHVTGALSRARPNPSTPLHLAVAVNGTIGAVTETFLEGDRERFSAVVPEGVFKRGVNQVNLFVVSGAPPNGRLSGIGRRSTIEYKWGAVISFGKGGNSELFKGPGWSAPEESFTWSDGPAAEIVLSSPRPHSPLVLSADMTGFLVPGKVPRQRVRVLVNRKEAGEWTITAPDFQERTLGIPENLLDESGQTVLTFETPDAVSPLVVGVGEDVRRLGLGLRTLAIAPEWGGIEDLPKYRWGDRLTFGSEGNALRFLGSGWSAPEAGVNWTDGGKALLVLPTASPADAVDLEVFARPFLVQDKAPRQRVRIYVNERLVGEWILTSGEFQEKTMLVPADFLNNPVRTVVAFDLPDAVSPTQLGIGGDVRRLGLAFRSLRLIKRSGR